ncbi:hypothetical protein LJD47_33325, partial [Escherichia coli]|nr:hypothetical protein [Escherichia coli]
MLVTLDKLKTLTRNMARAVFGHMPVQDLLAEVLWQGMPQILLCELNIGGDTFQECLEIALL